MGTGAVAGAVQSQSDSSAELATGTVSNLYDMRGRLVKQMQTVNKASVTETAETFVTQWAYNLADQVTQVTYPDGELLTSSYLNGSGLLKAQQLCPPTGTCANLQTGLQYDLALRLKSQTLGNGVVQTFNYYGWNAAVAGVGQGGGLQMQKYTMGTKTIYQASYSYDVLSNIKTLNTVQQLPDNTIRNDNYTYTYDAISRLTAASATSAVVVAGTPAPASNILNESYSYDGLGRMSVWNDTLTNVSKTYSYASQQPHAVKNVFYTQANAAQPGYQYGYDGAGNMQTKQTLTGTVAATQYTYSYDANGKLNQVKNNTGAIIAEFTYDAGGMRVLSKVNGVKTIRIGGIYEKEITGTGATAVTKVTKYYDGVALRVGSGTLQYLHRDHLGGVIAITNSSGAITRQERYKPFGETLWSAGTNIPTTQAYTGQKRESSFGLYDYNARWYDSALGRFTQADTIVPNPASAKAFDRYAYVYNNPINASDPSGHFGVCFQGGWYSQSNGGIDKNHPVTDVCKDLARSGAFGASGQYGVFTNDAAGIRSALAYFLKMIKELPNEITVVLGYSWGGGAAVEFSYALQKDSPTSRIDKMVLIDPVITWRDVTPERTAFLLINIGAVGSVTSPPIAAGVAGAAIWIYKQGFLAERTMGNIIYNELGDPVIPNNVGAVLNLYAGDQWSSGGWTAFDLSEHRFGRFARNEQYRGITNVRVTGVDHCTILEASCAKQIPTLGTFPDTVGGYNTKTYNRIEKYLHMK